MEAAKKSFKDLYRENVGKELSDAAAQSEVLKVYNSAFNSTTGKPNLEQGFRLASKSDPYFKVPDFFLRKSLADEALNMNSVNLSDLTGQQLKVIEDLFGKGNDAFQTILNGTTKLSGIVRRNEYYDNLVNISNDMKDLGKTPIFANSRDEAQKLFGGTGIVTGKQYQKV